ncbi:MAG: H+/Na+-translocating ferredoxin:NAD+ oxidoreductase subunit [Thermosediminibacterales bacterium]|nr:H+/Na+-translocating ferredoxin:NAD+ oxidoreductase subunit [Thermosediminibacterales bacterium]MDK2836473.1 H+/Na+-translocating ferredoxin:NAD+ oxidoreductase subunit [Thermosediminibacterales bacterium]
MKIWKDFIKGLWEENPTFRLLIGMCPVLAVTNAAINGVAMGLATLFVLVCSSTIISLIKNLIPSKVRIPCYIVVIATFVTIADLVLAAYFPDIHAVLGLFVPLIVVNCLILGRAEAFASKNTVTRSFFDALGMGLGFTWALTFLSIIREVLGMGSIFGFRVLGEWFTPFLIFVLPPGAFITLGIIVGLMNTFTRKTA